MSKSKQTSGECTNKPRETSSYDIGYGKPPIATRFQKGQSGNPNGRPKGSKSIYKLLDDVLSSTINITEAGGVKTIQQREAFFKALVAKAIRGDMRAASLVLTMLHEHQSKQEAELAAGAENELANKSDEELLREIEELAREAGFVNIPIAEWEKLQQDN